ncbi:SH3 domain-containing protein [Ruegeria atlantica]|uniref:SH3 domain-containing protein n=1 Tax=Ruegeria atlantica TaxID=81569 RepID=UPI0014802C15|nr:SH3 domain-containing protein [Ruegeria atlantica]
MRYCLLLVAWVGGPALADRQSFPPVDQADQDPSLVAFRDELLAQVKAGDTEAIVTQVCPDIYLSHGGGGGPEELRANLVLDPKTLSEEVRGNADALRDQYWTDLENTLSQPGYFDDEGEFWMPHQWQITLPASLDPQLAYFVTGTEVSLRQKPDRNAPILGLISYEIAIIRDFQDGAEYQRVLLTDGTQGYMHTDFLWPMTGYRAAFVKSDAGNWQLCTFVSGD